jgi:hypothetical protein
VTPGRIGVVVVIALALAAFGCGGGAGGSESPSEHNQAVIEEAQSAEASSDEVKATLDRKLNSTTTRGWTMLSTSPAGPAT